MNIIGKKVTLRAIEKDDLKDFHAWGNDPELWKLLGGWHVPLSFESTNAWFDKIQGDSLNIRLAIDSEEDGLVGLTNILDIDWKNKNAFHGAMIGNANVRGKGIGLDTVMTTMRFAFEELGLNRLDGSMIDYHEVSTKLYCGKCGWKEEGRQRQWYFRQGQYFDRIMVGITKEDYLALMEETQYWQGE